MNNLMLGLVLCGVAWAGDFQKAKIVDVRAFNQPGMAVSANGGASSVVINNGMFTLTLALDGYNYSANFYTGRHLKPGDLVVGDWLMARVDGDNLRIKRQDDKEAKAKIVRREKLNAATDSPSPPPVSR